MADIAREHTEITRRFFLAAVASTAAWAMSPTVPRATAQALNELEYLTAQEMFGTVERGDPLPYTLDPTRLADAGLTPDLTRSLIFTGRHERKSRSTTAACRICEARVGSGIDLFREI